MNLGGTGFELTRQYRGATYQIVVRNPKGLSKGIKSLKVDGKEIAGNVLPLAPAGATVRVEAEIG